MFFTIQSLRRSAICFLGLLFFVFSLAPVAPMNLAADEPNQKDGAKAEKQHAPGEPPTKPAKAQAKEAAAKKAAADVAAPKDKEIKLRFSFAEKPWKKVIEMFAEQSGLSLTYSSMPEGSFNYQRDDQYYTTAQALDLINSVLLTKGYSLVRHRRMLFVVNLEDGIPPALVEAVPLEELDSRGTYEIIKCVFPLKSIPPDKAEEELKPLLGPQGSLHVMLSARQVMVTETAGNLRMIRRVIDAGDNPTGGKSWEVAQHVLKFISAEEVLIIARPLLGLEEDANTSEDVQLSIDPLGTRIFATGKAEMIQRLANLIPLIDRDPGSIVPLVTQKLKLVVYDVTSADPETVLAVMQSMLAGQPGVQLASDPKSGNLVAWANADDHAIIKATLAELERDYGTFVVIPLRTLDPQTAILAITQLLALDPEGGNGPRIFVNSIKNQISVQGSRAEVEQIRKILEKLDGDSSTDAANQTGNVRFIPLSSRAARRVLREAEFLWSETGRTNRIRILIPAENNRQREEPPSKTDVPPGGNSSRQQPARPKPPAAKKEPPVKGPPSKKSNDKTARRAQRVMYRFVSFPSQLVQNDDSKNAPAGKPNKAAPAKKENPGNGVAAAEKQPAGSAKPPIVISLGPGGITIVSQDIDALNAFQRLLQQLIDQRPSSGRQFTVFPLTYSKAETASQLVKEILSGNVGGDGTAAAGILSQLGGSIQAGEEVSIIPDTRLNTLIVQGSAADLDLIEQLLEIIDRESSVVDVQTAGKPRLIPVFETSAEEIAEVVRQVYVNRIQGSSRQQGGGSQQSGLLQALSRFRGGGGQQGGRRTGSNSGNNDQQMMSLGVDVRSNSLVVTAPEPLFQEVKALVEQLDRASVTQSKQTIRVVTLKRANPELVQKALQALLGSSVKTSATTSSDSRNERAPTSQATRDQERLRAEFFNRLQFQRSRGGGDRGGGDRGGSRGGDRGFRGGNSGRPSGSSGSSRGRPQSGPSRGR